MDTANEYEIFDFNRCDDWHLSVHMDTFAAFLNAIQRHGITIQNETLKDGGNRLKIIYGQKRKDT